jgi:hypothetical protein
MEGKKWGVKNEEGDGKWIDGRTPFFAKANRNARA